MIQKKGAHIGDVEIGDEPKVVAVIGGENVLNLAKISEREGADIIEVRTDLFNELGLFTEYDLSSIQKIFQKIHKSSKLPILATIRRFSEGGMYYGFKGSEERRYEIFESITDYVHAIDIEKNSKICDMVIERAKEKDITIVESYHDFYGTPSYKDLKSEVSEMNPKADIVKVATMPFDLNDMRTLHQILAGFKYSEKFNKPITVVPMGSEWSMYRLFFASIGSCLAYAFVDTPNAPGQLSVREMKGNLSGKIPIITDTPAMTDTLVEMF